MYRVKVEDDEIVVTNPTNDWSVSYRRTLGIKGLRVTDVVTDRKAKVSDRAAFLGEAFSKATLRALKLEVQVAARKLPPTGLCVLNRPCYGTPVPKSLQ